MKKLLLIAALLFGTNIYADTVCITIDDGTKICTDDQGNEEAIFTY